MAVFRVENINVNAIPVNNNNEVTQYQIGRYISSNEAVWRIFGFPILERDPTVIHLAVHLENGDFRQTLPVIPRSTYADEINACLKSSPLWNIDDEKVTKDETGCIKLPDDFCTIIDLQDALINLIFPDVQAHRCSLAERAILAAKNAGVNELNLKIQQLLPDNLVTHKSVDAVCDPIEAANFPTEFLSSLDLPGIPPHNFVPKVGSPVILLRNLSPPRLCNST
ncbi:uncharacterized protein [Parasteatoda tepidariorum]|uniref:uncharacterized protein n=1 Tax=Parasteatoda tepidariorum TaxID=114398 RepID=UPI0039BD3519